MLMEKACLRTIHSGGEMKRIIFWATIFSGAGAAYLMYRRGVPSTTIAKETFLHPIGSFVTEMKST